MTGEDEQEEIRQLRAERAAARTSNKSKKYVEQLPAASSSAVSAVDHSNGNGHGHQQQDEEDDDANGVNPLDRFSAPQHLLHEFADGDDDEASDPLLARAKQRTIASRQNDYHLRRFNRNLDDDVAAEGGEEDEASAYKHAMRRAELEREEERVRKILEQRQREGGAGASAGEDGGDIQDGDKTPPMRPSGGEEPDDLTPKLNRKRRWDVVDQSSAANDTTADLNKSPLAETQVRAPAVEGADAQQQPPPRKRRSRWDESPAVAVGEARPEQTGTDGAVSAVTAEAPKRSSRWDQTPAASTSTLTVGTPLQQQSGMMTLTAQGSRYMSDDELDGMLPAEGYKIVEPPADYAPVRNPAHHLLETPVPLEGGGFMMQDEAATRQQLEGMIPNLPTDIPGVGQLAYFKAEDQQYFEKILKPEEDGLDSELTVEELKERKIMRLLLKIKNGTPPMRKTALRQITDKAREFGAGPLFDKILPLLMERSLEDQERHLLVKVIDRILYKLDDLVRPYVHRILVVIEPLLIDEDYYARIEGREIISNLSKAAGLAHMISTMRPDIDHVDEYVRNTTARAFAVVASALGIPALLPFLRVVCRSKKSWQARHTGMRIIQQIAIMLGCAVLPHLKALVDCVEKGLEDDQQKVKTMTALALAALAEAAAPYGIESFENVLKPLWMGIRQHRGKGLAAFLKAIGFIIPLMDSESTVFFVKEVTPTLIREFQSADEEMKKIVLKVVKQCAATDGVTGQFLKEEMLPEFFKNFWVRRMALDKRNYKQVVETTVELAQKTGVSEIVGRIVNDLKDESEPYRKMVMETISKVIAGLGSADIDERLEVQLIDGLIYAFQEQTVEDQVILDGFGTVVNALGMRCKTYLAQIVSTILWRLGNKNAKTRQQAADLVTKLAVVIRHCGEDALLSKLGVGLFEQLGEEFPEALASIISALSAVANVVGMTQMNPPIKDLLPRMTPILRNRHEKVQEASINLIGRIADRGAEFVSPREWMRITFELLDLLKAHKRAIRRAAVNSFGYIAKAIGPQDVLQVLLTNLRVQERQSRVCSTVAIAIVAETCSPFTTIPHILQEYRTPELNVRNGCLKALSFLFEYIGEMGKEYVNSVVTLLEDALTDRDHVHRQTAAAIVKHVALGVVGLGQEDALLHLLNLVWPNIFETSPHLIGGIMDAIEALRPALGPGVILNYSLPGLFHPARRVREVYARIYNTTYLQAQDAMVPFYPDLGELESHYRRHELYAFL